VSEHAVQVVKNLKKSLAMPAGIAKNALILRALGGYMRKFMRFPPRTLRFRSLLILGGALALFAAFTPRANADLLRFYDFEGTATPPYPVNLESHTPALETGPSTVITLRNSLGAAYPVGNTSTAPGIPLNLPPGAGTNLTSLGIHRSGQTNLNVDMPFFSAVGIYDITSVSFAYSANGNGYDMVQVQISTNGGTTFTTVAGTTTALPATPGSVISIAIPSGTTLNIPMLVVRLNFFGGQSNGNDLQFQLDNIQIGGTAVPEPGTVAAGLLGVLGLCWFQRRRLIRSVRFRKA
jgi:hypothetical protein